MFKPVGAAAIGLGRWARVLADAYTRSDKVSLVTCFTRDPEKRKAFAQRYGCDQEESLEALLERDDVEMVIVTVPNRAHADVVEQAARAGKHVFVEKPIAVSLDHARRIVDVVRETGIRFLCGHSGRRLGGVVKMKEMIDSGEIGDVSMVEAVFANERGLELEPGNWRGDPQEAPGGVLTQLGVHQIDNIQFLLGPIQRVFNFGKPIHTRIHNATLNQTLVEFADGRQAYLGTNWVSPGVFYINVYGTKASLFYDLDFSWWSKSNITDQHSRLRKREFASMGDDPDNRVLREVDVEFAHTDHLKDQIELLAEAVRTGREVDLTAEAALRNLAVVLAAVRSSQERRVVEIDEIIG